MERNVHTRKDSICYCVYRLDGSNIYRDNLVLVLACPFAWMGSTATERGITYYVGNKYPCSKHCHLFYDFCSICAVSSMDKNFLSSCIFPFNSPFETPSTLTWCKAIAKYSLLMPFKILGLVSFILHNHDEKGDDE